MKEGGGGKEDDGGRWEYPESEHQAKTDITLANAMQLRLEPVPEEPIKHCGSHRSCERVRFDSRRLIST
jgi:hypothetical protein